jgi:hypothetical protein
LPTAFTLVSFSAYSSTVKMEAICYSETSEIDNRVHPGFFSAYSSTLKMEAICYSETSEIDNRVHPGFFLGLFFDPEDGGDMLLRNVGD